MIGPGIEARFWRDFLHQSREPLGPTQPPIQWVLCFFPGAKTGGTWSLNPSSSSAEVEESVELSLYSPSGSSWPIQWRTSLQVDFKSIVLPCCILLQMSRWVRLASTGGPMIFNPTISVVTQPCQERIVGPCALMAAWTICIALQNISSYVNKSCGRRQVNLRDTNRTDLTEIYSR